MQSPDSLVEGTTNLEYPVALLVCNRALLLQRAHEPHEHSTGKAGRIVCLHACWVRGGVLDHFLGEPEPRHTSRGQTSTKKNRHFFC